ncbi:GNAT family N-acetyltransferase [Streptomyces sp. T-3]|nr:GNAT family N-acetyltransferase [Streptomyces sp. T-3]
MKIAPCRAEDVVLLDQHLPSNSAESHHRARFGRQEAGLSTYLIAWVDGDPAGQAAPAVPAVPAVLGVPAVPAGHAEVRWNGCAAPEVQAARPGCPEINGLAVTEALQSRGIGSALIRAAEALARERGLGVIGLGVDEGNPRAAALYARLGYRPVVAYTDRWAYVDGAGRRVECADACTFLVKELSSPTPPLL